MKEGLREGRGQPGSGPGERDRRRKERPSAVRGMALKLGSVEERSKEGEPERTGAQRVGRRREMLVGKVSPGRGRKGLRRLQGERMGVMAGMREASQQVRVEKGWGA